MSSHFSYFIKKVTAIFYAAAINSCEICSVIQFLNTKGLNAAKIHCEVCEIYGHIVLSEGKERQGCC